LTDPQTFRRDLLRWYQRHKRDLPWRASNDPYRVWISEIMLQQTRVSAVIPYYERFLDRFPTVESLASAAEHDLLTAWAGLGYYSRARNLHKAARQIVQAGGFPRDHESIRALAGIGVYTAAAIGSIAFGLKHAAIDGNVTRVASRVGAESGDIRGLADRLLDPQQPGDFNQAMMELGATICLPTQPKCLLCPVAAHCEARRLSRQHEFPAKRAKPASIEVPQRLLLIQKANAYLLWQRPPESRRMAGFWELPHVEQLPSAKLGSVLGEFRHTIVNTNYRFELVQASVRRAGHDFVWQTRGQFGEIPLSTVARKAFACLAE
jgi:A/G-specific adenine glycosylase